ncbi:Gfo/Idh/MocA family protein [Anaerocolumna xylanovorans]|uniref:Predicted dehydrogenase n=1 Tax=Anaerocolumna xylanovorans DSM 12503 TaxID=1121345 RepID=A0A1M7Y0H5_9FIRM|nr:Gfo/Idh/MocA family oxidoreductase [Anaerocolumna xylanovorans]SHO44945.1 Predicted dehydrogenase [Anaerocolumna xylanovorans DSM 12503]
MRLGIAGTGMIVKEFLTIIPLLKNIEVAAICGRKSSETKLQELSENYSIKDVFTDYDEFLSSSIDTVYVAVPNSLHFEYAKRALEASKNVILEKPFTSTYTEALELCRQAKEKQLFLFEAITTLYLPNYQKIRELIPVLGNIKIIQCNYSQYSKRYDSFKEGVILPAFDAELSGGALMDLNIYNIHYITGLFGRPKNVEYYPNIEKGIDTSGILILEYDTFQCTCIGAKDCKAPIANNIQGDKGCICQNTPANVCEGFEVILNNGEVQAVNENCYPHRMVNEFIEFEAMITKKDFKKCFQLLEHSLTVCEIQAIARKKAGIIFPADSIVISSVF